MIKILAWTRIQTGSPAGDPGSNPGPDENISLKLLIYDLQDGYSESYIFIKISLCTNKSQMCINDMDFTIYS